MVREFRATDATTPVVLMGYANPIERYGVERFVADAQGRGRRRRARGRLSARGMRRVRARCWRSGDRSDLPARADVDRRAHRAASPRSASGYVYYVSLKGVTGAGHFDIDAVAGR